jgi:hypothetical protein
MMQDFPSMADLESANALILWPMLEVVSERVLEGGGFVLDARQ